MLGLPLRGVPARHFLRNQKGLEWASHSNDPHNPGPEKCSVADHLKTISVADHLKTMSQCGSGGPADSPMLNLSTALLSHSASKQFEEHNLTQLTY